MLEWIDVAKVHQTVEGISVHEGRVRSILCNPGKGGRYPDKVEAERIVYYVNGNTPQKGISALVGMVGTTVSIRVFEKLGVNRWRDLGEWSALDVGQPDPEGFVAIVLGRRT